MSFRRQTIRVSALMSLALTAVLAVVALNIDVAPGTAPGLFANVGAEATEEATVRIAAQRFETGHTAFALQVRGADGWGERIEPRANILRRVADVTVGRWANSSLLELESGHTVRISARALEGGRIQVALQEVIDGEPSERLRPRSNVVPASPAIGRWLHSSSIQLGAAESEEPTVEEPTYVPLVNVFGQISRSISYWAHQGDDGISSTVVSFSDTAGYNNETVRLRHSCSQGERTVLSFEPFSPLEPGRQYDATFSLDGNAPEASTWTSESRDFDLITDEVVNSRLLAHDSSLRIERLRGASSLTVEIPATGLGPITFDLNGLFETPIQENLDECGNYRPGETRELPVELNTSGQTSTSDGDSIRYRRGQGPGAIPFAELTLAVVEDGAVPLNLLARCSEQGTTLFIYVDALGALSGAEVEVSWSLDGASERRETWQVVSARFVYPEDAAALLPSWRNGQELMLTVHGTTTHSGRIDLAALFSTPVQSTMDECLALPARDLPLPAGEVASTAEGDLNYRSGKVGGSQVAYTALGLLDGANLQDSARFEVGCGQDGVRVAIRNIGRGQFLTVSGETVAVTWRVGSGSPQSTEWDIWPNGHFYVISPKDDAAFYSAIRDADSLSYSVATDPVVMGEFDFAGSGFWSTPVQPNLDACPGS